MFSYQQSISGEALAEAARQEGDRGRKMLVEFILDTIDHGAHHLRLRPSEYIVTVRAVYEPEES